MKGLKFRVWDKERECYLDETELAGITPDGKYIWYIEEEEISRLEIDEDYVVEYNTGLKDRNGKEIYEGDIVQFNGKFFTDENIFYVDYECSHRGCFSLCTKEGYYGMFGDAWLEPFYCEVIGNVHDNFNLLQI